MKKIICLIAVLCCTKLFAQEPESLVGQWDFSGQIINSVIQDLRGNGKRRINRCSELCLNCYRRSYGYSA